VILEEMQDLTMADNVVKEARAMIWGGWEAVGLRPRQRGGLPGSIRALLPIRI